MPDTITVQGIQATPSRATPKTTIRRSRLAGKRIGVADGGVHPGPLPGANPVLPPLTDNLELQVDAREVAGNVSGLPHDGTPLAEWVDLSGHPGPINLLSVNQATLEGGVNGWAGNSATLIASSEAHVYSGSKSLETVVNPSAAVGAHINATTGREFVPVVVGKTYTAAVMAYTPVGPEPVVATAAILIWRNAAGGQIASIDGPVRALTQGAWRQDYVTAVAPAGAVSVGLMWYGNAPDKASKFYLDQALIVEGSDATWALPVGTSPNLLAGDNATFDTGLGNWTTWTQATTSHDTTNQKSGAGCAKWVSTTNGGSTGIQLFVPGQAVATPADLGKVWTGSVWVKGPARTVQVNMQQLGAANELRSNVAGASVLLTPGVWTQLTVSTTIVADVEKVVILVICPDGANQIGDVWYADEALIARGGSANWSAPGKAVHAPRNLTQAAPENRPLFRNANPNLLTYNQATVETDTTGFSINATYATMARSTVQARGGSASLLVTALTTAPSGPVTDLPHVDVEAGKTYTARASVLRGAGAPASSTVFLTWFSAVGWIGETAATPVTPSDSWQDLVVSAVAPPGAIRGVLYCRMTPGTIGDAVYWDNFLLVEGASSPTWVPPVTLPGGKPVVQYDGNDDLTVSMPGGETAVSVYAVFDRPTGPDESTVMRPILRTPDGAGGLGYTLYQDDNGGERVMMNQGPIFEFNWSPGRDHRCWSMVIQKGVAGKLFMDGIRANVPSAELATLTIPAGDLQVGVLAIGGLAAVLVYSKVHTDTERKQVEAWLGEQFGITVTP